VLKDLIGIFTDALFIKNLFSKMQTQLRHIHTPKRTTIRLETAFWEQLEYLAERNAEPWREWVSKALAYRPHGTGRASWLRVTCLLTLKDSHGEKASQ